MVGKELREPKTFAHIHLKSTLANHGYTPCAGGDVPAVGHLKGVMLKSFKVPGHPFC